MLLLEDLALAWSENQNDFITLLLVLVQCR